MKYRCFPLKRKIKTWQYFLPLGLIVGPLAFFLFAVETRWKPPSLIPVYLGSIFLSYLGWKGAMIVVKNFLPLFWDDAGIRWLFRKRRWQDLKSVGLLNLSIRQGHVGGPQCEFNKLLLFKDENGQELLRVPFQHREAISGELLLPTDPDWKTFLHFLENRYSFAPDILAEEYNRFQNEEERAASIRLPDPSPITTIVILITGFLTCLVLFSYYLPIWLVAVIGAILMLFLFELFKGNDDWRSDLRRLIGKKLLSRDASGTPDNLRKISNLHTQDLDSYAELYVSVADIDNKHTIAFKHPNGNYIQVKIEPGIPGRTLRFRGQSSNEKGDLYLRVHLAD